MDWALLKRNANRRSRSVFCQFCWGEDAVKVEPVGEFALKGIRRPRAAYNVVAVMPPKI